MQELLLNNKQEKSSNLGFYSILVTFFLIIYFLLTNVYTLVIVNGTSMENTLSQGDVLFVNKIVEYKRGDVIVFKLEDDMLIKRVIAIEGDVIKCKNGRLSIKYRDEEDFKVLNESYIIKGTRDISPTLIKEGQLFVLGDNRPISNDSSSFGPITDDCVTGVVTNFTITNKEIVSKLFGWAFNNKSLEG